jgi:peroxiredoxin
MMRAWAALVFVVGVCALGGTTAGAQSFSAFGFKPSTEMAVPAFGDDEIAQLTATLDQLLAAVPPREPWEDSASDVLWQFARRLQTGRLSPSQEAGVLRHLDQIAASRPEATAVVQGPRRMISELTVGKAAPDIAGTDLDGRALKLSDHRNKVVALVFSADWCAICRAQMPYQRFLSERYDRWPFALLGVETGSSRDAARQAHVTNRLLHRSWWDPGESGRDGPIATAWNVVGWPTTYIIDGDGIIRFVDLREEDLLKAVRQLVEAQADRDAKGSRPR